LIEIYLYLYCNRNNFDDTEESILKRIGNFNSKTRPVAVKYGAKSVSAERSADDIFADVEKVISGIALN